MLSFPMQPAYCLTRSKCRLEILTVPTIITHPAVPLALALGLGREVISGRLLLAGVVVSVLPDLDVVAFRLGVPYAAESGHRGFSHSILFASVVALLGACLFRQLHSSFRCALLFLFAAAMSHSVLDAFTNGGLGVAFLWPWSDERFFAHFQVIEAAPLSLKRFLSPVGLGVLWSELLWVWCPLLGLAFVSRRFRGLSGRRLQRMNPETR